MKKGKESLDEMGRYPLDASDVNHNLVGSRSKADTALFVQTVGNELRIIEAHVKALISEFVRMACGLCNLTYRPKGTGVNTLCVNLANIRVAWLQEPNLKTTKKLCWILFYLGEHYTKKITGKTEAQRTEEMILEIMNSEYYEDQNEAMRGKGRKRAPFVQQIYTAAFNVSRCNVLRRDKVSRTISVNDDEVLFQKIQVTRPKGREKDRIERKKEEYYLLTDKGLWMKVRKYLGWT